MSAQDDLNASALAYAVSLGYTPPTPPPVVVPQFDGRASTAPSPFPTTSGTGNVTQTPSNPTGLWDGYTYMGADVKLAADPTWGKVYSVAPAAGHHNPYNTAAPAGATSAQITKRRDTSIGSVFYWSESAVVTANGAPDWGAILSLGYETVLNDQLQLGITGGNWTFGQTCGLVTNGRGAVQYTTAFKPVVLNQRADFVVGAKIAADNTGWVEVHYRPQGGAWSQPFTKTGVPTTVWQGSPANIPATVLDKEGLYFGWWDETKTPAPTGAVTLRGLQRWGTLADAIASLG